MRPDIREEMLAGIKSYLLAHFPDVEFSVKDDPKGKSVLFEGNGRPRYRLEITERFLDGEEGTAKSLHRMEEWDVAAALRAAKTKRVTLATTGLHTSVRPGWSSSTR